MLSAYQLMVLLWHTSVMTSFRCLFIMSLTTLFFYFLEPLYTQMFWCWSYYFFIFNSGMDCRILSQRCGRLCFPIFLFRVRLFTLYVYGFFDGFGHIVSLPAYDLEVFHKCCVASVVLLFCSLYLSPKVVDDSPIYSSSWSILSHLNQ